MDSAQSKPAKELPPPKLRPVSWLRTFLHPVDLFVNVSHGVGRADSASVAGRVLLLAASGRSELNRSTAAASAWCCCTLGVAGSHAAGTLAQRCLRFRCRVRDDRNSFWYWIKGGNGPTSGARSSATVDVHECIHGVSLAPPSMASSRHPQRGQTKGELAFAEMD